MTLVTAGRGTSRRSSSHCASSVPGHYLSPGLDIPLAGTWEIRSTVRTGPVDRVDLTGDLEIR